MDKFNHARYGNVWVDDTSENVVDFFGFTLFEDTTLTAITATSENDVTGITGITLKAGYYPIAGSSITRASGGNIMLHKRAS